jgi:hypothetical protein
MNTSFRFSPETRSLYNFDSVGLAVRIKKYADMRRVNDCVTVTGSNSIRRLYVAVVIWLTSAASARVPDAAARVALMPALINPVDAAIEIIPWAEAAANTIDGMPELV